MKRAAYSPITSWDEIPLILDIPLICRMLGKSYEGVKKMCQRGRIPAFKAMNGDLKKQTSKTG